MSEFWSKIGEKISRFLVWGIDNHPGKFIGTTVGFVLGLLMAVLGFWRALVIVLFIAVGFIVGKRQDDNKDILAWLKKFFKKY
jgi:uncharacterized membrane protein